MGTVKGREFSLPISFVDLHVHRSLIRGISVSNVTDDNVSVVISGL